MEGLGWGISYTKVKSTNDADRLGFVGSPSIVIKGVDLFRPPDAVPALACRMSTTEDGPQGAPTVEQLRAALADLLRRPRNRSLRKVGW